MLLLLLLKSNDTVESFTDPPILIGHLASWPAGTGTTGTDGLKFPPPKNNKNKFKNPGKAKNKRRKKIQLQNLYGFLFFQELTNYLSEKTGLFKNITLQNKPEPENIITQSVVRSRNPGTGFSQTSQVGQHVVDLPDLDVGPVVALKGELHPDPLPDLPPFLPQTWDAPFQGGRGPVDPPRDHFPETGRFV